MKTIEDILGIPGKMISFSKSGYRQHYPDNFVVFNSNICTREDGKVWYGDIDVTVSKQDLIEVAKTLNRDIYILYEMDARFENEDVPLFNNYVIKFCPNGTWTINPKYEEYYKL